MRNSLLLITLLLAAGCQAAPRSKPVAVAPPAVPVHAASDAEAKLAEARRFIGALLEQNDVLRAQLRSAAAADSSGPAEMAPNLAGTETLAAPSGAKPPDPLPDLPLALPNPEGIIDLAVLAHPADATVNPFTLRASAADPRREVGLLVQGLCAGPNASALINDRVVQVGDAVESLTVERIEPDAVILRTEGYRLKLVAAEKPTRVRLP
ncbi:MAG: general secretion pathway protein GspB [Verrucomicrobia bacterium]|nr:general secretion pathway protein GspB [Verrucomicrobiota bacterium]